MKKIFALLLVAVMLLSFGACGTNAKNAIVGEWKDSTGITLVFNDDGTGVYNGQDFTWKYDNDLDCYVVAAFMTINVKIEQKDDIKYVEWIGSYYYHSDDFEKGFEIEKQAAQDEINSYLEGRTKIEIGQSYDCAEGVTVKFTGATVLEEYQNYICLEAAFTSDSSVESQSDIEDMCRMPYKTHLLYKNVCTAWVGDYEMNSIRWGVNLGEYGGADELVPGETVEAKGQVFSVADFEYYGTEAEDVNALICCFDMNGEQYYIDITEYIK